MSREIEKLPTQAGLMFSGRVREFEGLNNVDDESTQTLADLTVLRNTDVDDKKRLRRRRGTTRLSTGNMHSLWSDGKDCFVVTGTNLCALNEDWTFTVIRTDMADGRRLSYAKAGDQLFYSNGLVIGAIKDRAGLSIPPLSSSAPTYKSALFPAPLIEQHGARLYLVSGRVLWYTDALSYYVVDRKNNFYLFESDIQMVRSVESGLYVSDENNVWWIEGKNPKKSARRKVSDSPAVMYSDISCMANLVKDGLQGIAAVWIGSGIHIGLPDGTVVDIVEGRYEVADAVYGAPLVRTDGQRTQYICSLQK